MSFTNLEKDNVSIPEIEVPIAPKGTRWSDRRHASPTEITAIVVLVIQLCALVWGAAKLSAAVDNLQGSVNLMQTDIRVMSTNMQELTTDVRVLQSKTKP